jgi:hypothetical protein
VETSAGGQTPYCKVLQGIGGIRPPALPFELTSPNAFLSETAAAPQKDHSAENMRLYQSFINLCRPQWVDWARQNTENATMLHLSIANYKRLAPLRPPPI